MEHGIFGRDDDARGRTTGRGLTRRDFLAASAGAGLFALGLGGFGPPGVVGEAGAAVRDLEVFRQGYPRAFFYRQSEGDARSGEFSYAQWEKMHLPLDGIVGKVLSEAHYYKDDNNQAFFLRYKQRNPAKMVLLHYNGTGRRATDEATTKFFPGHFLHYQGTRLTANVGATRTNVVLPVQNTAYFKMGRYRDGLPDDISIMLVDSRGKPRWETAEQVRLKKIDAAKKTITVTRGFYGTRLRSFPAGSYLAPHVTTGPYYSEDDAQNRIPLWAYNFSTVCPRDPAGRNCGEALVNYLAGKLGPGGVLSSFDGIAFDVFYLILRFGNPIGAIDTNGDGRADGGIVGGKNVVGLGTLAFARALRQRLPGKIITADGSAPEETQRSFGYFNGAETEGFPDKYDIEMDHLSTGENIFRFWGENSTGPTVRHMTYAYKEGNPEVARNTFVEPNATQDRSYKKLRLVLASAQFTDASFAYRPRWQAPETLWKQQNVRVRVFDELWRGLDQQPNWLGKPLAPAVQMATQAPDRLRGQGVNWPIDFIRRFEGRGLSFSRITAPGMTVKSKSPVQWMRFKLPRVNASGPDLLVSLRLKASPLGNYPASVARRVHVTARHSGTTRPAIREFTWANGKPFTATFYFKNVGDGPVDIGFEVEGGQPITFLRLTAHSATNAAYREFENGVVFANPSKREYTFNLDRLFPGVSLRRIQGTVNQDPLTNNGLPLGSSLRLRAKDALFAVKT